MSPLLQYMSLAEPIGLLTCVPLLRHTDFLGHKSTLKYKASAESGQRLQHKELIADVLKDPLPLNATRVLHVWLDGLKAPVHSDEYFAIEMERKRVGTLLGDMEIDGYDPTPREKQYMSDALVGHSYFCSLIMNAIDEANPDLAVRADIGIRALRALLAVSDELYQNQMNETIERISLANRRVEQIDHSNRASTSPSLLSIDDTSIHRLSISSQAELDDLRSRLDRHAERLEHPQRGSRALNRAALPPPRAPRTRSIAG